MRLWAMAAVEEEITALEEVVTPEIVIRC